MCVAPGASLHSSAKPMWLWHPGVQRCLPVCPQWPQRSEACLGCILPCCCGSRKGLSCLGLSFSPSPFWWPSCVAIEVAFSGHPGMEPRAGGPAVPGDAFRDTKDSRILHCVGSSFSTVSFWHIVSLGVFFCPAVSPFAVGMEGKFPPSPVPAQVWHPGSDACLPCGFFSLGLRCLICKAGGDDTSSSLCWALSQVPELHLFWLKGCSVVLQ